MFLPADKERSDHEEHQQRLLNNIESWGFQMHSVEGDGNCCFSAVAFALVSQRRDIQSVLPHLFAEIGIEDESVLSDIALTLRKLAVAEWIQHAEEYKGFIDGVDGDGDKVVEEEAKKFLQVGYFHGPLGNTMVLALSNVL